MGSIGKVGLEWLAPCQVTIQLFVRTPPGGYRITYTKTRYQDRHFIRL